MAQPETNMLPDVSFPRRRPYAGQASDGPAPRPNAGAWRLQGSG
jgi:hypothetical protein